MKTHILTSYMISRRSADQPHVHHLCVQLVLPNTSVARLLWYEPRDGWILFPYFLWTPSTTSKPFRRYQPCFCYSCHFGCFHSQLPPSSSQRHLSPFPPCFMFHAPCSRHPIPIHYLDLMSVPYPVAFAARSSFCWFLKTVGFTSFPFCDEKTLCCDEKTLCSDEKTLWISLFLHALEGILFLPILSLILLIFILPLSTSRRLMGPFISHRLPRRRLFFLQSHIYRIVYYYITFQKFLFFLAFFN